MDDGQIREFGIPKQADLIVASFYNSTTVKAHPDYIAAKNDGDVVAACRLVSDLVKPETVEAIKKQVGPGVVFVAPHMVEQTGNNVIPSVLAEYYAVSCNGIADQNIVQTSKAYHTGAPSMERMISRATFEGFAQKGGLYVLVDDVITLGGTAAELHDFIHRGGGKVGGVVTLINASRQKNILPQETLIQDIERRLGNECREVFRIEPRALTAAEAVYIGIFRDADTLRNRANQAKEEINSRLLSKGVFTPEKEVDLNSALNTSEKNFKALMLERGINVEFLGKQAVEGVYMGQKVLNGKLYSVIDSPLNTPTRSTHMIPFAPEHTNLMRFRAVQFDGAKISYSPAKILGKTIGGKGLER